jgi:hypothetical protein
MTEQTLERQSIELVHRDVCALSTETFLIKLRHSLHGDFNLTTSETVEEFDGEYYHPLGLELTGNQGDYFLKIDIVGKENKWISDMFADGTIEAKVTVLEHKGGMSSISIGPWIPVYLTCLAAPMLGTIVPAKEIWAKEARRAGE